MNTTKSGHKCLRWDYMSAEFSPGDDPQNFCRNPKFHGAYASDPWCNVDPTSQNGTKKENYEVCTLNTCGECLPFVLVAALPVCLVV